MSLPEPSDAELLARWRVPDQREAVFRTLMQRYQQRVYWLVRPLVEDHADADDLTQNIFLKVWQHLDGFRGEAQLFTWIYRIATRECLAFRRQQQRRHALHQSLDPAPEVGQTALDGEAIEARLQRALRQLPDKQRLVFHLRYYDELPYQTISAVLGTSVGALKASYHHAVRKIEADLRRD